MQLLTYLDTAGGQLTAITIRPDALAQGGREKAHETELVACSCLPAGPLVSPLWFRDFAKMPRLQS